MLVSELRDELRRLGLKTSGRKADLVARLHEHRDMDDDDGAAGAAGGAGNKKRGRSPEREPRCSPGKRAKDLEIAFAKYRAKDAVEGEEDQTDIDGMLRLCADIGVDAEDPVMVALSWAMKAKQLGCFTLQEFTTGMTQLDASTVEELKQPRIMDELRGVLHPGHEKFKEVYFFAYDWACEEHQKSMSKETAVGLWPLLLGQLGFDLLPQFVSFVGGYPGKGVTKDVWMQTLHFVRAYKASGNSLSGHDIDNGAWPVLIDDFVEHQTAAATANDPSAMKK